jgi:hypothetical protein
MKKEIEEICEKQSLYDCSFPTNVNEEDYTNDKVGNQEL